MIKLKNKQDLKIISVYDIDISEVEKLVKTIEFSVGNDEKLISLYIKNEIYDQMNNSNYNLLLGIIEEKLVGYLAYRKKDVENTRAYDYMSQEGYLLENIGNKRAYEIEYLGVDYHTRNYGVGSALIRHLLEKFILLEDDVVFVELDALKSSEEFYIKNFCFSRCFIDDYSASKTSYLIKFIDR